MSDFSFHITVRNKTHDRVLLELHEPVHGEWQTGGEQLIHVPPGEFELHLADRVGMFGTDAEMYLSVLHPFADHLFERRRFIMRCPVFGDNQLERESWSYGSHFQIIVEGAVPGRDPPKGGGLPKQGHPCFLTITVEPVARNLVDVWGEGRLHGGRPPKTPKPKPGEWVTGFDQAININLEGKRQDTTETPIPNLLGLPSFTPEYFPLPTACAKYVVSMGSLLDWRRSAEEMARILSRHASSARIVLFGGADYSDEEVDKVRGGGEYDQKDPRYTAWKANPAAQFADHAPSYIEHSATVDAKLLEAPLNEISYGEPTYARLYRWRSPG